MPVRIRRFSVIKTANTVAVIYGIVIGLALALFGSLFLAVFTVGRSGSFGATAGIAGIVGLAIAWVIYTVVGWVFTALFCLVYNGAAKLTGGIEFELTQAPPPGWGQAGPGWGAPVPGAWPQQQPGPSWGPNAPPQGPSWGPPPGTSWGPNPPMPPQGPAWPAQPPTSGGQPWTPPRDDR